MSIGDGVEGITADETRRACNKEFGHGNDVLPDDREDDTRVKVRSCSEANGASKYEWTVFQMLAWARFGSSFDLDMFIETST